MCGRCACTREPGEVRRACTYRPKGHKKVAKPAWVSCSSQRYYPSHNICPQTNTPVLLSSHHAHLKHSTTVATEVDAPSCEGELPVDLEGSRVIQTMKWGLVPGWHQGQANSFPTLLNNCRAEGMMNKSSFRNAVQRGQRCVVLADGCRYRLPRSQASTRAFDACSAKNKKAAEWSLGTRLSFFEWDRKDQAHKQPYFIYFSDSSSPTEATMELLASERDADHDEAGGETKPAEVKGRMLTMAGLFDIWRSGPDEEPLFTYTVITVDAHPSFGRIHHRMPAVLRDEALEAWLNPALSTHEVAKHLQPYGDLKWHPVSTVVNNSRNKSPECIVKIDLTKQVSSKQNTLFNWFSKSPKKSVQQLTPDSPSAAGGSDTAKGGSAAEEELKDTDGCSPAKKPKLLSEH